MQNGCKLAMDIRLRWTLCVLIYVLVLKLQEARSENIKLLQVNQESDLSVPELWEYRHAPLNTRYFRHDVIDQWTSKTPYKVRFLVRDLRGKTMFRLYLNATGASSNISTWFSNERNILTDFTFTSPFTLKLCNESLELIDASSSSDDMVYFATGKYNGSVYPQFIAFTRQGSLISLNQAVWSRSYAAGDMLYEESYRSSSGTDVYYIPLCETHKGDQYVRGIAIYNENNTTIGFDIRYSPFQGNCKDNKMVSLKETYTFIMDGNITIVETFKVSCIWVIFPEKVYSFNITLYQPAESFILGYSVQIYGEYENANINPFIVEDEVPTELKTSTTSSENTEYTTRANSDVYTSTVHSAYTEDITYTSTTTSTKCECQYGKKPSNNPLYQNLTQQELEIALKNVTDKIKRELSVNKSTLSSTTRKKTSASDNRPSATSIGYVGGLILGLELSFILLMDILWYFKTLKIFMRKCSDYIATKISSFIK